MVSLLMGDALSYDLWAQKIASGDWLGHQVFYQAPLYPYFMGLLYWLFGHNPWLVRVAQMLLGTSSCLLLAQAGRHFFGLRTGLVAGVLLAVYPMAIYFDGLIQKSVLDTFFMCLLLCEVGKAAAKPQGPQWIRAGVVLGVLGLVRENALVLAIVIAPWIFFGFTRQSWTTRSAWIGYFVLGLAIALFPVALRNKHVGGEFHLTTSQFGPNLFIGNNEHATGMYQPLREGRGSPQFEQQDATELAEAALGRHLSAAEVSQYWTESAWSYIRSNPDRWLRLMFRKWLLVWNGIELGDTEDPYTYGDSSVLLRGLIHIFHFGILCPVAVFGMVVTWIKQSKSRLLVLMLLSYGASVALFYVFGRYRFPLVPILVLFAAAGVSEGMALLRERRFSTVFAYGAVALGAGIVANWEFIPQSRVRAATQYNLGVYLSEQLGDSSKAIDCYIEALRLDPHQAAAHNNLGNALERAGRLPEAMRHLEEALRIKPDYAEAHYNLGDVLIQLGKVPEAIGHYEQALRIKPDFAAAHNNLGNALATVGKLPEAVGHWEQALRIKPDYAAAKDNLVRARTVQ